MGIGARHMLARAVRILNRRSAGEADLSHSFLIGGRAAERGQMTVEMAVCLPVLIIVIVIAVNALCFFHDCAVFDRVAHEAVRVYATSPAYGQDIGQDCASVEQEIRSQLSAENLDVSVTHSLTGLDFDSYTATLAFTPTLFGMGLRSSVFGVSLPRLTHATSYVVDRYRAGVFV